MSDNVNVAEKNAGEAVTGRVDKYLTFILGDEEYGLEILKVRTIIGLMDITHIPRAPEYVRGVINLRGKVIPVIDTRIKFSMGQVDSTEKTCIIVVEVERKGEMLEMGILVDSVQDVLGISENDIEDSPEFGANVDTKFIMGVAKVKGSVKILLDINKVLSEADLEEIAQNAK
ncbi:MAG: chemotaxis protein CheW [Fibrobacterota bacterium]